MLDFLKEPLALGTAGLTFLLTLWKLWQKLIQPKLIQPVLEHFRRVHASFQSVEEIKAELMVNGGHSSAGQSLRDIVLQLQRDHQASGQSLSRLEGLVQAVLSASPDGVWLSDEHGSCLWVNGWFAQHIGWMPHEMHGAGWKNTIHPDCREEVCREWEACVREHRDFILEFDYTTKAGRKVPVSARCSPMRRSNLIIGHVGFVQHAGA